MFLAKFTYIENRPIKATFESGVDTKDHNKLFNRDLPDQHPIDAITGLQEVLDNKADISDIPTKTSDLTNDSGFITNSALDGYATENWVENQGYLTEIPAEYVTDSELTTKGYQTAADVETAITSKGYTTMSAVEAKGYITNAALVGYATENYVDTGLNGKQDKLTQTQLDAVNSGANTTNIGQIATNTSGIADINALIPNQATSSNQLADKSFVNSSINNMAAFYITSDVAGDPFATRAALIAGPYYFRGEIRTPTQNDYALVSEDETHDDLTSRYMYDGGQWVWQYTLNNTKFTQAQIDAINSGITDGLVAKISTNETAINNHIADKTNPHEVTKAQVGLSNVDNTSDLNKPISTATQTALNSKQDTISDLATIRSGAALGATAVQPSDLNNYVTTDTAQDITGLKTIKNQLKIQSGNADGALFIGADATATTLRNNVRKLARVNMPTNEDITLPITIISGDTRGDTGSTIGQTGNISNRIEFGGRTGATGNTSPDGIAFCVAKVHNSKLVDDKVYALEMSATQARFNVQPKYNNVNLATETYVTSQGFITSSALTPYVLSADLATVATSGSYNDLSNKPTIPTVDQTYDGTSTNAQSGVAIASVLGDIESTINTIRGV